MRHYSLKTFATGRTTLPHVPAIVLSLFRYADSPAYQILIQRQFCANDPDTFAAAAKLVERDCDGVDLNLGCPQGIAKKGHYGAFLMDEWELITRMIQKAANSVSIPISCKMRIFPDPAKTVQYAQALVSSSLLITF